LRDAAVSGLGVAMLPRAVVEDLLQTGRLVRLLEGFRCPVMPVHAVYPASRRQVARVEAVVQVLLAHLQPAPLG
jgi:DNA-binding transcriptional LysR family regulator